MINCNELPIGRRRLFWSTQPDACGTKDCCGNECGLAGLELVTTDEGTTVSNANWVRGLMLNIFMTDARLPASQCGNRPGASRGHWSESFREDGLTIGTGIRYIPVTTSVPEAVQLIQASANETVQKLVQTGVAITASATASYAGDGVVNVAVTASNYAGETFNVNISAERNDSSWIWVANRELN